MRRFVRWFSDVWAILSVSLKLPGQLKGVKLDGVELCAGQ